MTTQKFTVLVSASVLALALTFGASSAVAGEASKAKGDVWKGEEIVVEAKRVDKDPVIVEAKRTTPKSERGTEVASRTQPKGSATVTVALPTL